MRDCAIAFPQTRFVFDGCKVEDCKIISRISAENEKLFMSECKEFHEQLLDFLRALNIEYIENPALVRVSTITPNRFEFWDRETARKMPFWVRKIHDLVQLMGGSPAAVGFAAWTHCGEHERSRTVPRKMICTFSGQLGYEAKKNAYCSSRFARQVLKRWELSARFYKISMHLAIASGCIHDLNGHNRSSRRNRDNSRHEAEAKNLAIRQHCRTWKSLVKILGHVTPVKWFIKAKFFAIMISTCPQNGENYYYNSGSHYCWLAFCFS